MSKEKLVFPGSFLGYEEEFLPGQNTYEDRGGVYSAFIGKEELDSESHEAKVRPLTRDTKLISKGTVVLGVVSMLRDKVVILDVFSAEKNGKEVSVQSVTGALTIENMANGYVKTAKDLYRLGDVVKARVFKVTPYSLELDTQAPEFGVVKAFGIKSRKPLHLIDGKLRDLVNGSVENRKISKDYILR